MSFIEKNWMLILVTFVASGLMLLWPLILQRRLSPVKEVGNAERHSPHQPRERVLLDVRETSELAAAGKLPNAIHIPLSQLKARMGELSKLTSPGPSSCTARGATRSRSARRHACESGIRRHLFAARRPEGVEGRGPAVEAA